jgi:hypothetical protein
MIVLIKLIIAHLIADFVFQPKAWVKEKENKKVKSRKFYFHLLIHGVLILLILWQIDYWQLALMLVLANGIIDIIKLYLQQENKKAFWFLIDQGLHGLSIFVIWALWFQPTLYLSLWQMNSSVWVYAMALIFLTVVSGVLIRILMAEWSESLNDSQEESLNNAGKYIGMLERLFVFTFVITGNWEAIGFLLAAKSVFRFGDLKESKDRKLTEYILIGTLLSFGIAIATGMMTLKLIEIVY